ncbi:MAG: hypothetical protein AVDCRST_MAG91-1524, partial [uncultured Sphingomonadaceae bacterium]
WREADKDRVSVQRITCSSPTESLARRSAAGCRSSLGGA